LLDNDFDDSVGFPPKRIKADKGTEQAFRAVAEFLSKSVGLEVRLSEVEMFEHARRSHGNSSVVTADFAGQRPQRRTTTIVNATSPTINAGDVEIPQPFAGAEARVT
jgi:hypothetical protein